jgi:drug/metabolite transporter (DMT)-like permease
MSRTVLWNRYASLAYLAVFIGVIGHASSEFVSVLTGLRGPEVSVWRFSIGALGLILLCLLRAETRDLITPLRQHFFAIVGLSVLGFSVAYLLFHWALDFATVPQVAITVTTMPIFLALVNQWRTGERITAVKWITGIAAVAAIAVLITDGALDQLAGTGDDLIGILMALGCAIFGGAFMVLARPYFAQYGAMRMTTLAISIAAVALWLGVGVLFGIWVDFTSLFLREPREVAAILTIGLYNTTITQWLWLGGLAAAPDIARASYLFFLKPVIAALLALAFLDQPVSAVDWLAIAVICGAVAIEFSWVQLRTTIADTRRKPA